LAEVFGTAALVLVGPGSVIATLALAGKAVPAVTEADLLGISFAFGFIITALVYAIGKVSGCHINPAVTFALARSEQSGPVRYAELARAVPDRPSLTDVREAVLALRRGKGMVIDPEDPDSISAGSFFVNPVLTSDEFAVLASDGNPPSWPEPGGRVKTTAAWLIEHAGFEKGFTLGNAGLSAKHTLAVVNRGGATARDVLALVELIQNRVREKFGIELRPEPNFIGF